ncbi:MAG: YggT family protein [Candidatus Saccharimonadales bacterium]
MNHPANRIQRFTYDIIYYVLWIIEMILLLRFLLKLLGANPGNPVVQFIYALGLTLMGPFANMFSEVSAGRVVFDPSVLIAMVIYAIIAYLVIMIIGVLTPRNQGPQNQTNQTS